MAPLSNGRDSPPSRVINLSAHRRLAPWQVDIVRSSGTQRLRGLAVALALIAAAPSVPAAHEIPNSVTILAFVKPEGQRLRLLLRVPLGSLRDYDFPLRNSTYLDIPGADSLIREGVRLWLADYIDVYENDQALGAEHLRAMRVSLPSDRSFASYDSALAHVLGPRLGPGTDIPWQQALVDVLFEYDIDSASSRFAIAPRLAWLGIRTTTVLRFVPADGRRTSLSVRR